MFFCPGSKEQIKVSTAKRINIKQLTESKYENDFQYSIDFHNIYHRTTNLHKQVMFFQRDFIIHYVHTKLLDFSDNIS